MAAAEITTALRAASAVVGRPGGSPLASEAWRLAAGISGPLFSAMVDPKKGNINLHNLPAGFTNNAFALRYHTNMAMIFKPNDYRLWLLLG